MILAWASPFNVSDFHINFVIPWIKSYHSPLSSQIATEAFSPEGFSDKSPSLKYFAEICFCLILKKHGLLWKGG